jgi:hypothetical protein
MSFNSSRANRTVEEYDREPTLWWDDNNSRPFRLSGGAVYELPFGAGKPMLSDGGTLAAIVGGWQTGGTFEYQPGSLVVFNTNLFYNGNVGDIKKGKPEISLNADGTLDATKYWFNIDGFRAGSDEDPDELPDTRVSVPNRRFAGTGPDLRQHERRAELQARRSPYVPGARRYSEPAQLRRVQQPDHRPDEHELRQGDYSRRLRRRDALLQLRGEVYLLDKTILL